MIRICLGNLGSGKTVSAVRELANDPTDRMTYTNIKMENVSRAVLIQPEDVIKKRYDEKGKPQFSLNMDYWSKQRKPLNILWDEIHLTANSRQSASKVNLVLSRFVSMARRITGMDKRGYGVFTFVAQKERTIDVNVKELANEVVYHISHWVQHCEDCGVRYMMNSERPLTNRCLSCNSWKIEKEEIYIERLKFHHMDKYFQWAYDKRKSYFERSVVNDIEDYFRLYDTLQIENIWSEHISS